MTSNMANNVFISYASENNTVARAIYEMLENNGISCWIAHAAIKYGNYADEIDEAIKNSEIFVLIFSHHTNQSEDVRREVHLASKRSKYIIPFRIEDAQPVAALEYYLSNLQWVDAMPRSLEDGLAHLLTIVLANVRPQPEVSRHESTLNEYLTNVLSRLEGKQFSIKKDILRSYAVEEPCVKKAE
jgi:hypothetical protein